MAYTVTQVAKITGVSVRTLHFYHEVGLLKPADWEESGAAFNAICRDLVSVMARRLPAESPDAQRVIRRHYEWLKRFWTPTRESYAGHSELIVDSELRQAYETHHPQLPEFAAATMKIFAEHELA